MKASEELARLQRKIESGAMDGDEPLFVLRARDRTAAEVVRVWARRAQFYGSPEDKTSEAFTLAHMMDDWPIKQVAGRPDTRVDYRPAT